MKNFHDYLNDAQFYLHDQNEEYTKQEKVAILRVVESFGLEGAFNEAVAKDSDWQRLADAEVFYFVDFVKPTPFDSDFKPYLAIIKPELGTKAVLKLVIRYDTFRIFC